MAQLSVCYWFGEGVELSDPLACTYAKMSAQGGDPYGMFLRAEHKLYGIITDKNVRVAFDYTKKALEKGYNKAKMTHAKCYFHALTVEQDVPKAIQLWTECIEGEDTLVLWTSGPATNMDLELMSICEKQLNCTKWGRRCPRFVEKTLHSSVLWTVLGSR